MPRSGRTSLDPCALNARGRAHAWTVMRVTALACGFERRCGISGCPAAALLPPTGGELSALALLWPAFPSDLTRRSTLLPPTLGANDTLRACPLGTLLNAAVRLLNSSSIWTVVDE